MGPRIFLELVARYSNSKVLMKVESSRWVLVSLQYQFSRRGGRGFTFLFIFVCLFLLLFSFLFGVRKIYFRNSETKTYSGNCIYLTMILLKGSTAKRSFILILYVMLYIKHMFWILFLNSITLLYIFTYKDVLFKILTHKDQISYCIRLSYFWYIQII